MHAPDLYYYFEMNPCVIPKLSEDHDGDERKLSMVRIPYHYFLI